MVFPGADAMLACGSPRARARALRLSSAAPHTAAGLPNTTASAPSQSSHPACLPSLRARSRSRPRPQTPPSTRRALPWLRQRQTWRPRSSSSRKTSPSRRPSPSRRRCRGYARAREARQRRSHAHAREGGREGEGTLSATVPRPGCAAAFLLAGEAPCRLSFGRRRREVADAALPTLNGSQLVRISCAPPRARAETGWPEDRRRQGRAQARRVQGALAAQGAQQHASPALLALALARLYAPRIQTLC